MHAVYREMFHYSDAGEYGRQHSRMTREDAKLHAAARGFHIGESVPVYEVGPLRDDLRAPAPKAMSVRLVDGAFHVLERTLDEVENAAVRLGARR